MSRKLILMICFVLCTSTAFAGDFVFHTGEVITGKRASCGSVCSSRPDALRISKTKYNQITRFHKVDALIIGTNDDKVVEMTQAEKDIIIQAEVDAKAQAIQDALDKFDVSNLELFTALIQRINVRIPNNPVTKAEIIQQIKDNR